MGEIIERVYGIKLVKETLPDASIVYDVVLNDGEVIPMFIISLQKRKRLTGFIVKHNRRGKLWKKKILIK